MSSGPTLSTLRTALSSHSAHRLHCTARRSAVAVVVRSSAPPRSHPLQRLDQEQRQQNKTKSDPGTIGCCDFEVLFVRRADNPGDPWSGQVSFPGGKQDVADGGCDRSTAVRETFEEIGVDLRAPRFVYLGQIDDRSAFSRGTKVDLSISTFVFEDVAARGEGVFAGESSVSAGAGVPRLTLRPNPCEVSAARWVPASELCFKNVTWDAVEFPFALKIFPILKAVPKELLELCGLFTLRFPSLPLHKLKGRAADTGSVDNPDDLAYNLWGLTFRITEDLLALAGTRQEDSFGTRHPPCLFPQRGFGTLVNCILNFLHRHNLTLSYTS